MFSHLSTQHQILAWIYVAVIAINIFMAIFWNDAKIEEIYTRLVGALLCSVFLILLLWGAA